MALVGPIFFDTSVLLAGLIELGPASSSALLVMDAIARRDVGPILSAWHCCLEFYAVSTRLPAELRLPPDDALRLIEEEILTRVKLLSLPREGRIPFLRASRNEGVVGGRIYDVHIAEIARLSGARTVVTENRRHFTSLMPHGIRVLNSKEFVEEFR